MKRLLIGLLFLPMLSWASNLWTSPDGAAWIESNGYSCDNNGAGDINDNCINLSTYQTKYYKGKPEYLVWLRLDYSAPRVVSGQNYDQEVSHIVINCNTDEVADIQDIYYYQGSGVTSGTFKWSFSSPAPDSIAEFYYKYVCGGAFFEDSKGFNDGSLIKSLNAYSGS